MDRQNAAWVALACPTGSSGLSGWRIVDVLMTKLLPEELSV
jgi:hypothetical protein